MIAHTPMPGCTIKQEIYTHFRQCRLHCKYVLGSSQASLQLMYTNMFDLLLISEVFNTFCLNKGLLILCIVRIFFSSHKYVGPK